MLQFLLMDKQVVERHIQCLEAIGTILLKKIKTYKMELIKLLLNKLFYVRF